jgi:competence protein ComEC
VCLGVGIGLYMAAPAEPGWPAWAVVAFAGLLALAAASRSGQAWAPLFLGLALVAGGAGLAGLRTHAVAAPVLTFRYFGPVEGRIVGIDRSASDALRLTLDRVALEDVAPDRTPARVRVSLHGDQRWLTPEPGRTVMLARAPSRRRQGPTEAGASTSAARVFDRLMARATRGGRCGPPRLPEEARLAPCLRSCSRRDPRAHPGDPEACGGRS